MAGPRAAAASPVPAQTRPHHRSVGRVRPFLRAALAGAAALSALPDGGRGADLGGGNLDRPALSLEPLPVTRSDRRGRRGPGAAGRRPAARGRLAVLS